MDMSGVSQVASVLADPSRAEMCVALLDGRAWTVGELAGVAGVAPSTATGHVDRLEVSGLVQRVRQGRHVYVRLADPQVVQLLEGLATRSRPVRPTSLSGGHRLARLARARTCYDHLAGALGVGLRNAMVSAGLVRVDGGVALTDDGRRVLAELGVVAPARDVAVRDCLDWTERREHLSGSAPQALLRRAIEAEWVSRRPDRSVVVAAAAVEPLSRLGLDASAWVSPGVAVRYR